MSNVSKCVKDCHCPIVSSHPHLTFSFFFIFWVRMSREQNTKLEQAITTALSAMLDCHTSRLDETRHYTSQYYSWSCNKRLAIVLHASDTCLVAEEWNIASASQCSLSINASPTLRQNQISKIASWANLIRRPMRLLNCRYLARLNVCKPQPRMRTTHVTNANNLSILVSVVYCKSTRASPNTHTTQLLHCNIST